MCFLRAFLPLLLLGCLPLATAACPHSCRCADDIVDCKGRSLTYDALPASLASSTRRLYLNNNYLTFIPSGFFDHLKNLHSVSLWGNPWDCTCDILYLRSWLQWQQNRTMYRNIVCSSPAHLEGRIITYLSEDEILSTCQYWYCSMALIVQVCLFLFILVQAILLFIVLVYVCRFQRIAKEARRTTAEISEHVDSWRVADMGQDD